MSAMATELTTKINKIDFIALLLIVMLTELHLIPSFI